MDKIQADLEIDWSQFLKIIEDSQRFEKNEIDFLKKTFQFGQLSHKGQKRASGKDYFTSHCVHVAIYLNELKMSTNMIAAGLLHDTLEDTSVTKEILIKEFGEEVAFFVDGVSNLGELKYRHYKRHVASLRKFFVASAKDVRVIIIKLCDRYHNLKTLHFLPLSKQKRIAEESMLIHAQLAQRLNMTVFAQHLNDLAFPYVFPKDYQRMKTLQKASLNKLQKTIERIYRQILIISQQNLNYTPSISKRIKSDYSLYKKLLEKDWNISAIYDIVALRIIVKTVSDCYKVLGFIHKKYKPLPGRFKDYIALPKTNSYQSLHTTVFAGNGQIVELQIKTQAMHDNAELGLASHLDYKNNKNFDPLNDSQVTFHWIDQLQLLQNGQQSEIEDYLKQLKTDFFTGRVFVTTPKGDVIDLIAGATILDFAFAVHSDLGLTAKGGLVNGIYKSLKTELNPQDVVEIITDKKIKPQATWLNWIKSPGAKMRLKIYLNKQKKQ